MLYFEMHTQGIIVIKKPAELNSSHKTILH